MTETLTLTDFLLARLAEDEAVAKAMGTRHWWIADTDDNGFANVHDERTGKWVALEIHGGEAVHIARHDPARVLADVEAKRRIVDEHAGTAGLRAWMSGRSWTWPGDCQVCEAGPGRHRGDIEHQQLPCPTLRALASVYADHPDYRDEWRP